MTTKPAMSSHSCALAIAVAIAASACGGKGTPVAAEPDPAAIAAAAAANARRFAELSERYIAEYAAAHPVTATEWGIHLHNSELRDLSEAAIGARVTAANALLADVEAIDRETLTGPAYYDYALLDNALRAELLDLEEILLWRHNPMGYNREIAAGLASLVERDFAPLATRLESLIARLEAIPEVTAAARANLRDVPEVWASVSVGLTQGTLSFVENDLPAALEAQGLAALAAQNPALFERWQAAHARARDEVAGFARWLERDLLPTARGDFRLGRMLYERKLTYEEHVDTALDDLYEMNEAAIRKYQAWVKREAARIDPDASPAEVMAAITSDYPAPDALLETARGYMADSRRFLIERELLTLPSQDVPIVRATPAYARTGFASMSVPGPFEAVATEAYYNITTVDPAWDADKTHQHLTYFNHPGLLGITVHEAFPGHFVQLLYRDRIPTNLRRVVSSGTLIEGWAHYTEQMMIDEGLGGGDPKIRLGQLRRALQRHARWYAGMALHVYGEPLDEVAARFGEIAYFAPFPAMRETVRGTYNPTYLYYALGRLQILALREQFRAEREASGGDASLRAFHDQLLALGLPPALAARALVSGEGSAPDELLRRAIATIGEVSSGAGEDRAGQ